MSEVRLILGDCLKVLPTLDRRDLGALICDPPFGISHSSNHGASWMGTTIASDHDTSTRDSALSIATSLGIPWAAFGTWKTPPPNQVRGCLVWNKGPASGMGDLSFPWKPSFELIYVGGDGWLGRRDEGVVSGHTVLTWESKGRTHPHEKPVSLIVDILEKLPPELCVVDPFMGTGSVGVACVQTGRNFIGIEIDPTYFAIAERRIKEAQTTLWTAPTPKVPDKQLFAEAE